MKITEANYFSEVYPKLDFAKLHPVFKEGHELISDITENGQNWNTYKSIKEVETEVDAYFRNLNALQEKGQLPMKGSAKKKGSAKGKAVISKATKAKAAKASRTTATKKVAAKRATSKTKVEPVKAVAKPAPKAKAMAKPKFKVGDFVRLDIDKKDESPSKITKVLPNLMYETMVWNGEKFSIPEKGLVKSSKKSWFNLMKKKLVEYDKDSNFQKLFKKEFPQAKIKSAPKKKAGDPNVNPFQKGFKTTKAKAKAQPKATQADKDKATLKTLKSELVTVKAQVVSNAKFKAKVGDELAKYLKSNGLDKQIGLSGINDEIKQTRASLKFYKGLLSGDKADFKSIGKRVGIIYQVKPVKRK